MSSKASNEQNERTRDLGASEAPKPGSAGAVGQGCTCPRYENRHGEGTTYRAYTREPDSSGRPYHPVLLGSYGTEAEAAARVAGDPDGYVVRVAGDGTEGER